MAENSERQTNKERLKEITDGIEQGIKELFESDKYRTYLSVMSRFHRYSVNNTMLIYMQRPDASLVAGFQKWKNQFGRHVKKGERGITIIAPTPFKKKIEEVKLDPDTKAPMLDPDGKQITEEREISIPMFKPVKVFDVSQTDGKPLPHLASTLTGSVEQYEIFVEALRRSAPVPVSFKAIEPNTDGYFSPTDQAITIREGMSEVQTISALVHEIAHSKLHNPALAEDISRWKIVMVSEGGTRRDFIDGFETEADAEAAAEKAGWRHLDENEFEWRLEVVEDEAAAKVMVKDRHTEEVEAESVSYAVCQYFGIETGENSFGYIATWSQGKELKALRASLETINKTASELITDVDRNFAEICKERGIDPKALPEQEAPEPEALAPDAYQLYAADLCDHLDQLHQNGMLNNQFTSMSKEETAKAFADMLRHGSFDSARNVLADAAERSGVPAPDALLTRLEALSDQWDKGLTYQMEKNVLQEGESYVLAFEGETSHGIIFSGPTEVCQKLLAELKDSTMTARQARAMNRQWEEARLETPLGEPETLYLLDKEKILHIQATDAGFDYTLYDADSMKAIDGGQFSVEGAKMHPAETLMDGAFKEVCILQGLEPVQVEPVPLEKLNEITEANDLPPAPDKQEQEADNSRLKEIEHYAVEESAVLLDTYPMPDDTVSMGDLEGAGYLDGDMLPITRDRAYEMMDQGLTVYGIVDGGTAEMCLDNSDIDALPVDALFSVPKDEWEESQSFDDKIRERMDRQEEREAAFLACPGDAYAIYQVKHTAELSLIRFESMENLQSMGQQPQRGNYDLVYTRTGLPEGQSPGAILDKLWEDFNIHRPADYHSPSMSVSDIIAIKQGGEVSYHYCDSVGFQKLPGFNQPENYLKAAEMAMEDDYGMIDGIINNGPKQPTVAELEAQVKAGQTISLMDLAAAVKAEPKERPRSRSSKAKEERPSIMERLKQPLPKQTKKSAPQRSAEKELI